VSVPGVQLDFDCPVDFHDLIREPVRIEAVELVRYRPDREQPGIDFVRVRDGDGAQGVAKLCWVGALLHPIFPRLIPAFAGRDARDLAELVKDAYRGSYKFHGAPLWSCIAALEAAVLDLLGQRAGRSVAECFGGPRREPIPVYLSFMRRDTEPEAEVELVAERLAATGARAAKVKVGGRMGRVEGPIEQRSERLIPLLRERVGDAVTLYVDANSSYDSAQAIRIGRLLEAHGYAMFEEPCPYQDYDETRRVTAALAIPVSGGEQDDGLWQFRHQIRERVVDVIQPDLAYAGGFLRSLAIARWAQKADMPVTPHSPRIDSELAELLHFAAVVPNTGPYLEYPGRPAPAQDWFAPGYEIDADGAIALPEGPGFGIRYDEAIWRAGEVLAAGA